MSKCRCPICGRKDSNTNHVRSAYIRAGVLRDEHGRDFNGLTKRESRKLLRTREKRTWKQEVN